VTILTSEGSLVRIQLRPLRLPARGLPVTVQ